MSGGSCGIPAPRQASADLRFKFRGFSGGIEPFIFKSARARQWPGVRDYYESKSVEPKRQAPTSHRDNLCARPAGHKAEKPRTLQSRSAACFYHAGSVCSVLALLLDHSLILVVGAYPDPDEVCVVLDGDGAVIDPNPRGP